MAMRTSFLIQHNILLNNFKITIILGHGCFIYGIYILLCDVFPQLTIPMPVTLSIYILYDNLPLKLKFFFKTIIFMSIFCTIFFTLNTNLFHMHRA